ncbi:MAG: hypothetical protein GWN58_09340, partial [Anaerolineae bacterium]|nr:hypothetical protein [Anaerolineae bacterium]
PLGYLWVGDLLEAIERGSIDYSYVKEHVERGYIRPSLLYQVDHGIVDGLLLPRAARKLDRDFRAPYTRLAKSGATPWVDRKAWTKALARDLYRRTGLGAVLHRVANRRR